MIILKMVTVEKGEKEHEEKPIINIFYHNPIYSREVMFHRALELVFLVCCNKNTIHKLHGLNSPGDLKSKFR